MEIVLVLCWLAVGWLAMHIGHRELHRLFPQDNDNSDLWVTYLTILLGPLNLLSVWIVFFSGLNGKRR